MMTYNAEDLKLSSYQYELPSKFVADRPVADRHSSKLLVYDARRDRVTHTAFKNIAEFLPSEATLVLNQSKVFPCRLLGHKISGAKVEIFVLSVLADELQLIPVLIKSARKKQLGERYQLPAGVTAELVQGLEDGRFLLRFSVANLAAYLEQYGNIPIPPYIRGGESDLQDRENYQTVYAQQVGSVAAPTAGLHFSDEVFARLRSRAVDIAKVTLHVGLGTFATVKTDDIQAHKMHREEYFVDAENLAKIGRATKTFAVGTTSLRVLESAFGKSLTANQHYATDIFLYPGKEIRAVDGLITNFHLPGSTLLMLVSALLGRQKTLQLYEIAKKENYRFFSYGDAMLIMR